jgi:hypothetical protein
MHPNPAVSLLILWALDVFNLEGERGHLVIVRPVDSPVWYGTLKVVWAFGAIATLLLAMIYTVRLLMLVLWVCFPDSRAATRLCGIILALVAANVWLNAGLSFPIG